MRIRHRHSTRMAVAGVFAVTGLALAGCGGEDTGTGTDVEDVTEGEVLESSPAASATDGAAEPTAAVTSYRGWYNRGFAEDQATYAGQEVTLTGEVEGVVSEQAFSISDPNDVDLDSLLVVHNMDQPPAVEEGQLVQVVGTVQTSFDPATASEDVGVQLDENVFGDFEGDPWIQATEVSTDVPTDAATEGDMGETGMETSGTGS